MSRRAVAAVLALAAVAAPLPAAEASSEGAPCSGRHWVGAWTASPGNTLEPGFARQTLRMIVSPHMGGRTVRIRLTNRFGRRPVTFERVRVAHSRGGGPSLVPGSGAPVTFGGRAAVTLPAGADVASDPVAVGVEPFEPLAVSMFVAGQTGPATQHVDAHQYSYWAPGDHAADETGAAFGVPTFSWQFLLGVDVVADGRARGVVAFGDSITDGFQQLDDQALTMGSNTRYPDFLARRLLQQGLELAVLNAGISGNEVLRDADTPDETILGYGPAGLRRLQRDVIEQPGVVTAIVLEGTNDIAAGATAGEVTAGLRELVGRLRNAGVRVVLGTLLPAAGSLGHSTPEQIATLEAVNDWIRTAGAADAVVDFNAAVRDPREPTRWLPPTTAATGSIPTPGATARWLTRSTFATSFEGRWPSGQSPWANPVRRANDRLLAGSETRGHGHRKDPTWSPPSTTPWRGSTPFGCLSPASSSSSCRPAFSSSRPASHA